MKIVIQAGHINCQYNSIVSLRGNTGAPGEQEVNKRVADRLSAVLRGKGFEVLQTNACANDDKSVTKIDHDLFLALHCDADAPNDNGGGFADFPEPSTDDATKESQRITKIFNDLYFKETKIVYKNGSNAKTRYYYMWKYLTAKTPCVLIEMGQSVDPHDKVLLANTDLIVNALARCVCKAFGVLYDVPDVPTDPKDIEITMLKKQLSEQKTAYDTQILNLDNRLAEKELECQVYKEKLNKISVLSTL